MGKKKTRNKSIIVLLVVLIILILVAFLVFRSNYVIINQRFVDKDESYIDLRGCEQLDMDALMKLENPETIDLRDTSASAADIASFRDRFPECRILWTVELCEGLALENEAGSVVLANSAQVESLVAAAANFGFIKEIKADYPNLTKTHYNALVAAFPDAKIEYSIVIGGQEVSLEEEKLDISALSYEEAIAALEFLDMLPNVSELDLVDPSAICHFTLDEIIAIHELCPDIKMDCSFELFGKEVSSSTERLEYYDEEIGDEGLELFRKVLPIMHGLQYLRFDGCGTSDEAVAKLRDEFPEKKIVWLLTLGDASIYTDTLRLWATRGINEEEQWKLKYCTEARYVDVGHEASITDVEWVKYMPDLEVLIIACTSVTDISPLAECKNLEFLEIFTNKIKDLGPLAELENLEYLNISNLPIDDISPIFGLEKLKKVNCNMCRTVPQGQIEEFKELHPDTVFNYFWTVEPTESGWRFVEPRVYNERYSLLRRQMGYDGSAEQPAYLTEPIE